MGKLVAAAVAVAMVPVLYGSAAQAAGDSRHVKVQYVGVKVGDHRCTKTEINGVNNHGTVLGTIHCGDARAFIKKPNGKTTIYKLPPTYAHFTYGGNIASD